MDDIQRAIDNLRCIRKKYGFPEYGKKAVDIAISTIQELQQYKKRIEQLKHAEVIQFRCKLPDGRICHFTDFIDFLEKGEVD